MVGDEPVPPKSPDQEVAVVKSSVSSVSKLVGVFVILSQWLITVLSTTVVRKPGSFVKSLRVTAVKFISESPTASALMSTAFIVLSTISLDSISVPRVALTMLLASIVIPVPAVYAVPLSKLHDQVLVAAL